VANPDKLIEQARQHLDAGESIEATAAGSYETKIMGSDSVRSGVLLATDRRVIFFAKKLGGYELESFPYGNISSFEQGKSMMGHSITFYASNNRVHVKWINSVRDVAALTSVVKAAMSAKHTSSGTQPAATPFASAGSSAQGVGSADVIALLKQLGELRDAGVVTADEFERKKAELLARI